MSIAVEDWDDLLDEPPRRGRREGGASPRRAGAGDRARGVPQPRAGPAVDERLPEREPVPAPDGRVPVAEPPAPAPAPSAAAPSRPPRARARRGGRAARPARGGPDRYEPSPAAETAALRLRARARIPPLRTSRAGSRRQRPCRGRPEPEAASVPELSPIGRGATPRPSREPVAAGAEPRARAGAPPSLPLRAPARPAEPDARAHRRARAERPSPSADVVDDWDEIEAGAAAQQGRRPSPRPSRRWASPTSPTITTATRSRICASRRASPAPTPCSGSSGACSASSSSSASRSSSRSGCCSPPT